MPKQIEDLDGIYQAAAYQIVVTEESDGVWVIDTYDGDGAGDATASVAINAITGTATVRHHTGGKPKRKSKRRRGMY